MPPGGPTSRADLVRAFRALGFEGPFSGGKHQFMERGGRRIRIPNPHRSDVGWALLSRILDQAGISRDEWESV